MPFSPVRAYMRVTRGKEGESRTGRTDESACRFFTGLGALANIAYSLDIVGSKAAFITLKHDEAVLDPEV